MIQHGRKKESGLANGWMVTAICLIVWLVVMIGICIWLFITYSDLKNNYDSNKDTAVAKAKNEQAAEDDKKFVAYENALTQTFDGPDDYGDLKFLYPRIWSAYFNNDASDGGDYEAYLNPSVVPPVGSDQQQFALRVLIESKSYDEVVSEYNKAVEKKELKYSGIEVNGVSGSRFDGMITKNIRGSVVIFKIRDKTLTVRTDADNFKDQFDAIIKTIEFDK